MRVGVEPRQALGRDWQPKNWKINGKSADARNVFTRPWLITKGMGIRYFLWRIPV